MGARPRQPSVSECLSRLKKTLPPPGRSGESEGWQSLVWTRGSHALRFRLREDEYEVNEYEKVGGELRSSRYILGSFDFCLLMAQRWFSTVS